MSPRRPGGVTLFCFLAILAALFDLVTAQMYYFDTDALRAQAVADNRTAALVQLGLKYFFASVALLTCYFMLRAKNWARWTYLIVTALHYGAAFALLGVNDPGRHYALFAYHGAMLPGLLLFGLALYVLFTADAREYFHGGGRPWWQIEDEEDEREARRASRARRK